jgi:hypothetical protein
MKADCPNAHEPHASAVTAALTALARLLGRQAANEWLAQRSTIPLEQREPEK